jgi:Rrf2 family protein
MKIRRSTGYALVAVGYIAQNHANGAVLASDVSKKYDIPMEYLSKILQQLVRSNILKSKRGPRGGFRLARAHHEVTLLEIFEAIDGPMGQTFEIAELACEEVFTKRVEVICRNATNSVKEMYGGVSVADILAG